MIKIGFDIGGVISKYPYIFRSLIAALRKSKEVEVFVISDMHDKNKMLKMLNDNIIDVNPENIYSADYTNYGEECKSKLCNELNIDILIDDFPGYLATIKSPLIRLLVMPDPTEDYYHFSWKTDGSEGDFGRRKKQ